MAVTQADKASRSRDDAKTKVQDVARRRRGTDARRRERGLGPGERRRGAPARGRGNDPQRGRGGRAPDGVRLGRGARRRGVARRSGSRSACSSAAPTGCSSCWRSSRRPRWASRCSTATRRRALDDSRLTPVDRKSCRPVACRSCLGPVDARNARRRGLRASARIGVGDAPSQASPLGEIAMFPGT